MNEVKTKAKLLELIKTQSELSKKVECLTIDILELKSKIIIESLEGNPKLAEWKVMAEVNTSETYIKDKKELAEIKAELLTTETMLKFALKEVN